MVEDYHSNSSFPDVRWSLAAALGSIGLLIFILFLCAKKDKKKEKGAEQTNGTSNTGNTANSKDVCVDIIPQFGTTTNGGGGQIVHNYENTQIPQVQPQHPNVNPLLYPNNDAQRPVSGFDNHNPVIDKDRSSKKEKRENSKKGSQKKKDKKEKEKKNKEEKKGSEKRLSDKVERREKDEKESEKEKKLKKKSGEITNNIDAPVGVPATIPVPAALEFSSLPLPSVPIQVADLDSYLRESQKSGEIQKQYKAIPRVMGYTTEDSEKPEQREKNRYRNIVPYDYNRVKLDILPKDPHSHYINASLIDDFHKTKQYIASQGPIEATINDFWRMIWEHDVGVIVMVTNPWERGMKCLTYWPEGSESSVSFGDIEVFLEKKDVCVLPDYTIRKLTTRKGDTQRQITQLQFRTWPDHGVPRHGMALLSFRDKVRSEIKDINTPVVIHCSAGVGRTGTFLAIDQLIDQAKDEEMVDVPACVCRLRKQRSDLVQTVEQYGFIYQAVLEYLVLGQTTIPCFQFEEKYNELKKQGKDGKASKLKKQFEMLDQFMAERPVASNLIALEEENRSKNRSSKVIPTDEVRRVKLLSQLDGHSNYINAVFADGHRSTGSFIATETPLPHTIVDFWRMIHEYQCSIIIMLTPVKNLMKEDIYFPLAAGEKLQISPYEIECVEKKDSQGIELRKLRMLDRKEKKEIYHMALSSDLQMDAEELLEKMQALFEKILRRQLSHKDPASGHQARPVVAHCLNGIQWTGYLVVLCHLFDQINNDQEVDIFNAVRQSRLARPQFIGSEEQYIMLHDIVKLYIDSFETYSNFK